MVAVSGLITYKLMDPLNFKTANKPTKQIIWTNVYLQLKLSWVIFKPIMYSKWCVAVLVAQALLGTET